MIPVIFKIDLFFRIIFNVFFCFFFTFFFEIYLQLNLQDTFLHKNRHLREATGSTR